MTSRTVRFQFDPGNFGFNPVVAIKEDRVIFYDPNTEVVYYTSPKIVWAIEYAHATITGEVAQGQSDGAKLNLAIATHLKK